MSKSQVIGTRVGEELYKQIEKEAQKRKETVSEYVRSLLYSIHFPTGEILSTLEENKNKLDYSIDNAREYVETLIGFSESLQTALEDFQKRVESGAVQIPLKERRRKVEKVK